MCIGIIEIFLGCYIMFKNKKFFVMVLLFILFSFTACSDEKDVGDIFEKIKEANNTIQSYILVNEINSENRGTVMIQTMKAELINDKSTKEITKGKASIRYSGNSNYEQNNYDAEFVGDEDKTMIITKKVNGKENRKEENNVNYNIYPNYFKLLDGIYSIEEKDLKLEETDTEYHLKLKNDNKSLKVFNLLKSEYKLALHNVSEKEVDMTFEAVFDKNTFYLKNIIWKIEYSGYKGQFKTKNTTTYSDWNKVNLD